MGASIYERKKAIRFEIYNDVLQFSSSHFKFLCFSVGELIKINE
jgi:hypothetical protein